MGTTTKALTWRFITINQKKFQPIKILGFSQTKNMLVTYTMLRPVSSHSVS